MSLSIVILAAGKGKRMRSAKAKVLHSLAGKPLLGHVIDTARKLNPDKLVVVFGHAGEQLQAAFSGHSDIVWVEQKPQLGTGHALQQALPIIQSTQRVLVLYGDVPLIEQATLQRLIAHEGEDSLALLTANIDEPTGYGRIVRDASKQITQIVEEKDADTEQKHITEINTGIMLLPVKRLVDWLNGLRNDNAQQEYYLTDVIELAVADGCKIQSEQPSAIEETLGVNSQQQLSVLERYRQVQLAEQLMLEGVKVVDPQRLDIRGEVSVGTDVEIDVNVVFCGQVKIGNNVTIEPFCKIIDSEIADGSYIYSHSLIEESQIGQNCSVGPFARLRPATKLADESKVGNFVEVKKSVLGKGSKANHLSYIGDAEVGQNVNIGAGTITCNYDGANKSKTVIEDGAFIGSSTQLVAPVKVGKNTTIGAGSTITKDTPAEGLTLSRSKQMHIPNWQRAKKTK